MPAYNEAATIEGMVEEIINTLEHKRTFELIIVESNSTDGTREKVKLLCKKHHQVKLILESYAKGKGHAVRNGLKQAANEIILIFDADREYRAFDIIDLIDPIERKMARFVLGSRYQPGKPMRSFGRNRVRSTVLNIVHKLFAGMCNLLFSVRLRDPFTMYKVFLREDILRIKFVEDGFAFDVELVAKMIRAGNIPIEIPIHYNSRGFAEGKKIRFFRDGSRLPVALVYHRFSRMAV